MIEWIEVYRKDDKVVLDVFPRQAGGCTIYLNATEAELLAGRLRDAAEQKEGVDERTL